MVVGGMVVAGGAIMVGVATIMVGVEGLCRTTKAEVRAPRRARVVGSPGMGRVVTGEATPSDHRETRPFPQWGSRKAF